MAGEGQGQGGLPRAEQSRGSDLLVGAPDQARAAGSGPGMTLQPAGPGDDQPPAHLEEGRQCGLCVSSTLSAILRKGGAQQGCPVLGGPRCCLTMVTPTAARAAQSSG